jgi:CHAT domain-containing protein
MRLDFKRSIAERHISFLETGPVQFPRVGKQIVAFIVIVLVIAIGACFYLVNPHHNSASPESAEGLLDRADSLAWGNRWIDAQPLYKRAEQMFVAERQPSKALYAKVSQIPDDESVDLPATILSLTTDLTRPEASDPETRLRILVIRGMLEIDYDAAGARANWQQVETLAKSLQEYDLATRATGEQGIAAFLLGDTETAKKQVMFAWELSKLERDPAATVRYASVFGNGLVELHRYEEALTPLNDAIKLAASHPEIGYPTIAIYAKIDALAGLHRHDEALALANDSLARLQGTLYDGHKSQVYISRGSINQSIGRLKDAIADYRQSLGYSEHIENYRGITDAAGLLAQAYEQADNLPNALAAVNSAIDANTKIPDELYLVPRNLAIKAEITDKMGHAREADGLYGKSITLVDTMIQHAATANVQRELLAEMSDVYSDYFASLCAQKRYDEALQALERVRGRIETEALEHHANESVHPPTTAEEELTRLNLALIDTDDPATRTSLEHAIYTTELKISPNSLAQHAITHPVPLTKLQEILSPKALLIEYVLADPHSYAFAITHTSVTPYQLVPKARIETDANAYRKEIRARKTDLALAHTLYEELLAPVTQYRDRTDLIIVPDGALHLLPFSALADNHSYVLSTHTVDVEPSATVFDLLHQRLHQDASVTMPYIGVAAWTQPADTRNPILRAITGPERSQLTPLPESKKEVETIAGDLPRPSVILLGSDATETHFKSVSADSAKVIHLALHGYVDLDYPDRSALIFAPEPSGKDDGMLQVREIRGLHLKAKLVTLSACDTGVGPVAEDGVNNLVNAFIEAGADSVVSTLWELEDRSTENLMSIFYSQLAHETRKVDALRSAQLDLLNEGLPPYFWASFQIVGDPDGTL